MKERISRNPLNWADMNSYLLRMAKYSTDCEQAKETVTRINMRSRDLLTQIHKDRAGKYWDEVTETSLCDNLETAQEKLCGKYTAYQMVDMMQEIICTLTMFFDLKECFDAIRLMEEYEGGAEE